MFRELLKPGIMLSFICICIAAVVFGISVQADSTITLPVPEKQKDFTISIRVPPKTEPVTQTEDRLKLKSKRSLIVWNGNPSPKLDDNDEFYNFLDTFKKKGFVKSYSANAMAKVKPMDKYYAVRLLQNIVESVLEFAQVPDLTRAIRKSPLTASDIEDLRRMINRFNKDLRVFGIHGTKWDKDLLMLQERFKTARQGVLKVIKVEGVEDGGTIIHLSVD